MASDLQYNLGLDPAAYVAGAGAARAATKQFAADTGGMGASIGNTIKTLAAGWLSWQGAMRLARGFTGALKMGDELDDLSKQTGQSVHDLVILKRVFGDVGVSLESGMASAALFQSGLSGLNDEGQKTDKAFAMLGLSMENLRGKPLVAQLSAVSGAMEKIGSQEDRMKIVRDLFGRQGGGMLRVFGTAGAFDQAAKDVGARAAALEKNAATFGAAADRLEHVKEKMGDFFLGVAENLTPALDSLLKKLESLDLIGIGKNWGRGLGMGTELIGQGNFTEALSNTIGLKLTEGVNWLGRANAGAMSWLTGKDIKSAQLDTGLFETNLYNLGKSAQKGLDAARVPPAAPKKPGAPVEKPEEEKHKQVRITADRITQVGGFVGGDWGRYQATQTDYARRNVDLSAKIVASNDKVLRQLVILNSFLMTRRWVEQNVGEEAAFGQ